MEDRTGFTLLETALITRGTRKNSKPIDYVVTTVLCIVFIGLTMFIWAS